MLELVDELAIVNAAVEWFRLHHEFERARASVLNVLMARVEMLAPRIVSEEGLTNEVRVARALGLARSRLEAAVHGKEFAP